MKIKELFSKDIFRSINGVVKAEQTDESTVWQELDEFVVTRELTGHIQKFFSSYAESIRNPRDTDVTGRIGVWVSGFFGSGKSHFIKILSYVLHNQPHTHEGQKKQAIDFFKEKVPDPLTFADIKTAGDSQTEVILFNIDSRADTRAGRDAILAVFLKVLNELQGYCPEHAHIAHMERYLDEKGKLADFEAEFERLAGSPWKKERDAYAFNRDEVVSALSTTLGQSKESSEQWVDNSEDNFTLSIDSFCQDVKSYLDRCGPEHRLVFLVDEVGAFIGKDGGLMLNLQTIVENLGTVCRGRAWVVVTSQEDLDKVLGEMPRAAQNDFSKIQGRFTTRLSLSSANVDEVIQQRLLAKQEDPAVTGWLADTFAKSGDVLANQLSFSQCGMTFPKFSDPGHFADVYPFAPYQFVLLQKVFEAIRRKGATGMNLAQGERSLLDAFQSASKAVADEDVGVLVPLYRFYPSIESFLDTAVKRTIDQARENAALKPFDNEILRVLFLIRYVEEMRGTADNLTTLCLDEIDADRLALKRKIEDSLSRLEKETLINRSGDVYFFLTNEERDINREIKQVELTPGEEAKALGAIVFDDILRGQTKFRYPPNKRDFKFNRLCDSFPVGSQGDKDLTVAVFTPMAEVEQTAVEDGSFLRLSSRNEGQIVIKLDDDPALGRELRQHLQTEKYLRAGIDDTLPETTKRIHKDLAHENTQRRKRLETILGRLLTEATIFACGQRLSLKAGSPQAALEEALEYLVANSTPKLTYINKYYSNPSAELQTILRSNDPGQAVIPGVNEQALDEVREFVDLSSRSNHQVVLHALVERFAGRPWGWPDEATLILVAQLLVLGEIQLLKGAEPLAPEAAYDEITASQKQRRITVVRRNRPDPQKIIECRNLGREVFNEMGPDNESGLYEFLREHFQKLKATLANQKAVAEASHYPGGEEIAEGLRLAGAMLATRDSGSFFERFLENKSELEDFAYDYSDVSQFYASQKTQWDQLKKAYQAFKLNRPQLEAIDGISAAISRMHEILHAKSPYEIIRESAGLIEKVEAANAELVKAAREAAATEIKLAKGRVEAELKAHGITDAGLTKACLGPFDKLLGEADQQPSIAHLTQSRTLADEKFDGAIRKINEFLKAKAEEENKPKPPPAKPRAQIRPADFVTTAWLENEADITAFLDKLKAELKAALERGERIQIK